MQSLWVCIRVRHLRGLGMTTSDVPETPPLLPSPQPRGQAASCGPQDVEQQHGAHDGGRGGAAHAGATRAAARAAGVRAEAPARADARGTPRRTPSSANFSDQPPPYNLRCSTVVPKPCVALGMLSPTLDWVSEGRTGVGERKHVKRTVGGPMSRGCRVCVDDQRSKEPLRLR